MLMDQKLLSESNWKAIAQKSKIKDNGLQRALADYCKLEEDAHDDLIEALEEVKKRALALKNSKEAAAAPEAVKYLAGMVGAAESEQHEVAKAKAAAQKQGGNQRKGEAQEEQGQYGDKLNASLQKLKGAKDLAFEFLLCDAKPYCGLTVAKKITPGHKEELSTITGGSKHFFPIGTCRFTEGHFVFELEQPPSGLARKIQDCIKNFTGKKLPIVAGSEKADEDPANSTTGQANSAAEAQAAPAAAPVKAALEKVPQLWQQMCQEIEAKISQLKSSVLKDLADQGPEVLNGITGRLDQFLGHLDPRLTESLKKASASQDAAARQAELKNARTILADCIKYVKSEDELLVHIDANPFGVKTDLKQTLSDKFKQMAQVIG